MRVTRPSLLGLLVVAVVLSQSGCSIRRMAVNKVGDALAAGGTTFASDNDPELVRAAVPFSLKLMESLLAESPEHEGLLLATASGFTQFGYAFVQLDAVEIEDAEFTRARTMKDRARKLYLRARDYGLRGLAVRHKGLPAALAADPRAAVSRARKQDVPLLYWTAASWAAAISVSKDDPDLIGDLPKVEALIDRALALDESWDHGAIHSFLITFEMSRQDKAGDAEARARRHFERAVALSGGQLAGPYVSLAEAVSIPRQDVKEFDSLLAKALAIDPDRRVEWRLVNLILQKHAAWLVSRRDELFLVTGSK